MYYKASDYNIFIKEDNQNFLFNSLSRACVKIDSKKIERIENLLKDPSIKENDQYKNILIKNGFVIKKDINEIEFLDYIYNSNFFRSDEVNLVLVPTLKCNFKCSYCFEANHKDLKENSNKYFASLLNFAQKNFNNKKKVHISLFGGEPLLKIDEMSDFIDKLTDHQKKYGYDLTTNIVTNGYLLNEKNLKKILKHDCIVIQTTLDGPQEAHDKSRMLHNNNGTYNTIVTNFKNAINYSLKNNYKSRFVLRINLMNQNVENIKSIFHSFTESERKKIEILFRPIYQTQSYIECNQNSIYQLKDFYDEATKYEFQIVKSSYYYQHCESASGFSFLQVTPDLKIWKCMNDLSCKQANIGYIDEQGECHIDSEKMTKWYKSSNPFKDDKCISCKYLPVCYGGCPLYFQNTGQRKCISRDMAIIPYLYH
jgi:uncharacterized protein